MWHYFYKRERKIGCMLLLTWVWQKAWNKSKIISTQETNLVEEVEDGPDFWSGPVQSYSSPVQHRFLIGLDRSTKGPLPDCDRKYVSVRTMPPGIRFWRPCKYLSFNGCSALYFDGEFHTGPARARLGIQAEPLLQTSRSLAQKFLTYTENPSCTKFTLKARLRAPMSSLLYVCP